MDYVHRPSNLMHFWRRWCPPFFSNKSSTFPIDTFSGRLLALISGWASFFFAVVAGAAVCRLGKSGWFGWTNAYVYIYIYSIYIISGMLFSCTGMKFKRFIWWIIGLKTFLLLALWLLSFSVLEILLLETSDNWCWSTSCSMGMMPPISTFEDMCSHWGRIQHAGSSWKSFTFNHIVQVCASDVWSSSTTGLFHSQIMCCLSFIMVITFEWTYRRIHRAKYQLRQLHAVSGRAIHSVRFHASMHKLGPHSNGSLFQMQKEEMTPSLSCKPTLGA